MDIRGQNCFFEVVSDGWVLDHVDITWTYMDKHGHNSKLGSDGWVLDQCPLKIYKTRWTFIDINFTSNISWTPCTSGTTYHSVCFTKRNLRLVYFNAFTNSTHIDMCFCTFVRTKVGPCLILAGRCKNYLNT